MIKPKIQSVNTVHDDGMFHLERVRLHFSNGQERTYERFTNRHRQAVMMVPLKDPETVLLVREYGVGLEDYHLSLPKGGVDAGESPEAAANRELKEEVGFGATQLTWLKSFSASPSYSGNRMDLFLAEDLYPEALEGDEPEPIEVVPWPLNRLGELMARDDMHEARAIAALFLVAQRMGITL